MPKNKKNLIEGNIKIQLFSLAWPMVLGMMGMVIFNLVDTYFVGKLGVEELAAMSFSFPVVMFLGSLTHGVGIGTASLISRNIIHKDHNELKAMSSRALLLGLIIVLVFVAVGYATIIPLFTALGAKNNVLQYVYDYMSIWYLGVPFVVIPMIGNNIVRATGDTFTPGMLMVALAVINAVLDPLFIFGYKSFPTMGIKGAAIATVIARGVGLIVIMVILMKREKLLSFHVGKLKDMLATWKKVLYIAGPAALTMLITPLSVAFLTKIISGFGKEAVAAFGVASRIEMFALMVIAALGSVLIIFVGQNLSKNKYQRILDAIKISSTFSMIWGVVIFIVLLIFGHTIGSLFTSDTRVIHIVKIYFYTIGVSYGLQGLVMLSTSAFNGMNQPYPAAIFSIIRMLVLYVPLAWIGSLLFDINGVFYAGLVANIIVGAASVLYLLKIVKNLKGNRETPPPKTRTNGEKTILSQT